MRQIKEINQERLLVAKLVFERLAPNRVEYIGKDRTVDGVETNKKYLGMNGATLTVKATRNGNIVTCFSNVGVSRIIVDGYFDIADAEQLFKSFETEYGITGVASA